MPSQCQRIYKRTFSPRKKHNWYGAARGSLNHPSSMNDAQSLGISHLMCTAQQKSFTKTSNAKKQFMPRPVELFQPMSCVFLSIRGAVLLASSGTFQSPYCNKSRTLHLTQLLNKRDTALFSPLEALCCWLSGWELYKNLCWQLGPLDDVVMQTIIPIVLADCRLILRNARQWSKDTSGGNCLGSMQVCLVWILTDVRNKHEISSAQDVLWPFGDWLFIWEEWPSLYNGRVNMDCIGCSRDQFTHTSTMC